MSRQISLNEVKNHKNSNSLWIVIHNDVYDVTSYLNEHPGGADALLDYAGKDGTEAFEEVGHSQDAREIMAKFKIGTLPFCERAKNVTTCCLPIPKPESTEKTWRTYDGSSSSRQVKPKSEYKPPSTPRAERRVNTIVVPHERGICGPPCRRRRGRQLAEAEEARRRRPRGLPCGSSKVKWALLALAAAIVIGAIVRKNMK